MPESQRMWYRFAEAKADKPKTTVLHIYDTIGADMFFGGVDAGELVEAIEKLDADASLEVRINSPGGSAWDGLTIAHAMMRHPGPTAAFVDGIAASAASIVALGGDTVTISKYGQMMLHAARGGVYGTAEDLKSGAEALTKLNGSMAEYYADRAGGEAKAWSRAMAAESWYNADEAKDAGLATAIDETAKREEVEAAALASITKAAAIFKYAGRQAAPAPAARAEIEEGPVPISETLAKRLGLPADASDEDVTAKIDELEAKAPAPPPADPPAPPVTPPAAEPPVAEGEVAAVKAAAAKLGLTVADPEVLAELRLKGDLGEAAHATLVTSRIAAHLDDAIDKGKILPTQRAKYEALMRKDEAGVVSLLADIPNETAAPMHELGHALDPVASADDVTNDPRFKAWEF